MTRVILPDRLVLRAAIAGEPLRGAFFDVELSMARKNSFRLLIGPADARGEASISHEGIDVKVRSELDLFPMDYLGLDAAWTGVVVVRAVDRDALRRLRSAHETWGSTGGYPTGFPDLVEALEAGLAAFDPAEPIEVEAVAQGGNARVRVDPKTVGQ